MTCSTIAILLCCALSPAQPTETERTLAALELDNAIYGEDRYRIVHLRIFETSAQILRVQRNGEETAAVPLPIPDVEVKNFSLSGLEETAEGFSLTAEWGGGRYFYTRVFRFAYRDGTFFLNRLVVRDQLAGEEIEAQQPIVPAIPIDAFELGSFLESRLD